MKYKNRIILVLFLIIFVFMNNFIIRTLVYPAPWINVPSPPPAPLKEVMITSGGNERIHCWYFVESQEAPFLIYFHGNGENLETLWLSGLYTEFQKLKINFAVLDYPGYGNSSGRPSEESLLESASTVIRWVRKTHNAKLPILAGWSLGASVAVQSASHHPGDIGAVIALSPWLSLKTVAREHYPSWLVTLLLKEDYDLASGLKKLNIPVLIIHGTLDEIIPVSHGRELAKTSSLIIRYLELPRAGHGDLFSSVLLWQEISDFIRDLK
jgi:pimeloyl-ACP methyl ester carboxylesterase